MNGCRHITTVTKPNTLLGLALHRSFSRSTMGLKFPQDNTSNASEKSWVNITCVAVAALGLGFSFFSTRQLCDDPNRRILWKK